MKGYYTQMFSTTELTPLRTRLGEGVSYTLHKTVSFWDEFADFLGRSSVAELAIGIVIGTAFQVTVRPPLDPLLLLLLLHHRTGSRVVVRWLL